MKDRAFVFVLVACLAGFALMSLAAPRPVAPVPVARAQRTLADLENHALPLNAPVFTKDAGTMRAVPLGPWSGSKAPVHGAMHQGNIVATPLPAYTRMGAISVSGARQRSSLDMPLCSLVTAPDTSISYFSGITAGDGYKIWMDPTSCPGCGTAYPFRVDSVTFHLVQADIAGIDTVYLGVDIECADFDPTNPCEGPGMERCGSIYYITLPADATPDGFLQVFTITLPLDTCFVDGPFFLGLFHLGHTDTAYFHPNVALDDFPLTQATDSCKVWANLSGTWQMWGHVWTPPGPGKPIATLYGECNVTNTTAIPPCPVMCGAARGNGTTAYYDPNSTAVWEWFSTAQGITFPYKPQRLDFSLYYNDPGSADDSVTVEIQYGCRRLGDICCAPENVLCAGDITFVRGDGAEYTVIPASVDLGSLVCCLPEDFWIGVVIVAVGEDDPVPSFLWSSTDADVTPPDCEEWVYGTGGYQHWPNGTEGWADFVLGGTCGGCSGDTLTHCPAYIPQTLICSGATLLPCGDATLTGQTNTGSPSNVSDYCCMPWNESGPEKVYSITVPAGNRLAATITNIAGGDVDVFILGACDPHSCIAAGDVSAVANDLAGGTYYIVVDGYAGGTATFDIEVVCFRPCSAVLCRADLSNGHVSGCTWGDGEWDPVTGQVAIAYFSGAGTTHTIIRWNPNTCDTTGLPKINWTASGSGSGGYTRMLATDPRPTGVYYWTGTALSNASRIYHVRSNGTVRASYPNLLMPTAAYRQGGAALDNDHKHLWVMYRSDAGNGVDYAAEFNVSDSTVAPVLIQGPFLIPFQSAYTVVSAAGADYAEATHKLIISCQGDPVDFLECFTDINPAYAGPPPGPGLAPSNWCPPDSNSLQGFGCAAVDNIGEGVVEMWDFTDANPGTPPHPIYRYPAPCTLIRCDKVVNSTAYLASGSVTLNWTPPNTGRYEIWWTQAKNNDGDPNNGADANFAGALGGLAATVTGTAGATMSWVDPTWSTFAYKNYVIVAVCP